MLSLSLCMALSPARALQTRRASYSNEEMSSSSRTAADPRDGWHCRLLRAAEPATLDETLGAEAASAVRGMCDPDGASPAAALCPAVPEGMAAPHLPRMTPEAALTTLGVAAGALFSEVCAERTRPWACGPPPGIIDATDCMHAREEGQVRAGECELRAGDLYGPDLADYQNAMLALKEANPEFHAFACETLDAPEHRHRIMCARPLPSPEDMRRANVHAAAGITALHEALCGTELPEQ